MAIDVTCPQCRKTLQVRPEYAGGSLVCPRCATRIPIADAEPPATGLPAPPLRRTWSDEDREGASRYKPCPRCGGQQAERVIFTFWGSFYGPALLCHVRCPDCQTAYNGRTGRSNVVGIAAFVTVPLLLIVGVIAALILFVQFALTH